MGSLDCSGRTPRQSALHFRDKEMERSNELLKCNYYFLLNNCLHRIFQNIHSFNPHNNLDVGAIVIPILQMRKLRHKEVQRLLLFGGKAKISFQAGSGRLYMLGY